MKAPSGRARRLGPDEANQLFWEPTATRFVNFGGPALARRAPEIATRTTHYSAAASLGVPYFEMNMCKGVFSREFVTMG
jgi:hypothetical protein